MLSPYAVTMWVEVAAANMGRGVRIIANPANDREFGSLAEELAAQVETPEDLERRLRDEEYANARVVRGVTDIVERWYAYRDGSWTSSEEES